VPALLSDVSSLEFLKWDLVSVRSAKTTVSLREDVDVGEVDEKNGKVDPDQSHDSLWLTAARSGT
jgi:hypothetical protein